MPEQEPIRIVITGAAGEIAYILIYQIAKGEVFGTDQPLIIHLLDVTFLTHVLEGIKIELLESALPLVREVVVVKDPTEAFNDVSAAFFLSATPRYPGIDRNQILINNAEIFKVQATELNKHARKDVKVLVVSNPPNTNALICTRYAPSIPKENISALIRLDQHRAQSAIAARLGVTPDKVRNIIIWGNHGNTLYPDASQALVEINGQDIRVCDAIDDELWLRGDFIAAMQNRIFGRALNYRTTSTISAAKAAANHMRDWWQGTKPGNFVAMGVISDGSYGVPEGLIFSFPVTIKNKQWEIVQDVFVDDFAKQLIDKAVEELLIQLAEVTDHCTCPPEYLCQKKGWKAKGH